MSAQTYLGTYIYTAERGSKGKGHQDMHARVSPDMKVRTVDSTKQGDSRD